MMGPATFFEKLPMRLLDFDMNSLSYAQDSHSYLLQVARQKLKRADIVFFVDKFVPLAKQREQKPLDEQKASAEAHHKRMRKAKGDAN